MHSERKNLQVAKCYVRSGVWGWSIPEQLEALERAGVLEPEHLYTDELPARRAKHPSRINPAWLTSRADFLRPSARRRAEDIAVATLTVLAPTEADLVDALAKAQARNAFIRAVDSGFLFGPKDGPASVAVAMQEWHRAKAAVRTKEGRTAGYLAAAAAKRAETKRKLRIVRPLWLETKPDRLSVEQIGERAELSPKTIYRAVKDGDLPRRPRVRKI